MRRGTEYNPAYIRQANMVKLLAVTKMCMRHKVLLAIDGDRLKSLSLAGWQKQAKVAKFEARFDALLGIFFALKGETRADVYRRLYDEARACGALLGPPVM